MSSGTSSNGCGEKEEFVRRGMEKARRKAGIFTFKKNRPIDSSKIKFIKAIGHGAFGEVSKSVYNGNRIKVVMAVKCMIFTESTDKNFRTLMDLYTIQKSSNCPYIVKFYGFLLNEASVQLCMQYMDTSLDDLVKNLGSGLPEPVIWRSCVSVLNALNYLEKIHNIIHRDVKPANILMDRQGNVKLSDFGISRVLENTVVVSNQGTQLYIPPERISSGVYGVEADVWALGVTLAELAKGRHPFEELCRKANAFDVICRIASADAPRLLESDGFSGSLCDFVEKCLQKDPRKRWKYSALLTHQFIFHYDETTTTSYVQEWISEILGDEN